MEAAGWVKRLPHEQDRRAHRIRLEEAGRRKYAELRVLAIELQAQVLAALPENKREEFLEHLSIVADACRQAADASVRRRT
jgi:DNA-binding MarR family transcriptional regulator